jgi:GT2 family glycosyltransferase
MTNIVLTVRDRYRLTKQTLESLYQHTNPAEFNLVVVDDGSEDFRTRRLVDSLGKANAAVVELRHSTHVLAEVKNLGVYWSERRFGRGDWLYLSDNDVYFKPGWLTRLTEAAEGTEEWDFLIWGGQAHPFHHQIPGEVPYNKRLAVGQYDCLAGTSWLMRWSTWDKFGPLTGTTPGVCKGEDWAFTERIRAAGGRIGVVHPHVVLDCSLTQSDGNPAPGADLKPREPGVWYE